MEQAVEIKGIRLQLGKKEVELSVAEARELKTTLEQLFGRDVVREVVKDGCHHWHWWGWQTVPWNGGTAVDPLPYKITYGADSFVTVNVS